MPCCPSIVLYFPSFQSHMPLFVAALHTEQRCWSDGMTDFSLVSLWSCCVCFYPHALSLSDCILHGNIQASKPADIAQLWFQQNRLYKIFLFFFSSLSSSAVTEGYSSLCFVVAYLTVSFPLINWSKSLKLLWNKQLPFVSWAVVMGPICTSWWLKLMHFTLQRGQMNCMGWTILSGLLTEQTSLSCCNWVITQSCCRVVNSSVSVQRRVVNSRYLCSEKGSLCMCMLMP